MTADAKAVVASVYAAWKARDLDAVMALMADDVVFDIHIPQDIMALGGATHGKATMRDRLAGIGEAFEVLSYEPGPLSGEGEEVRAEVRFRYRHKPSGQPVDMTLRHVWRVADGKVVRCDEYHDLEQVRSFVARAMIA